MAGGVRVLAFLDRHLLAILLMGCTAYGGYATAQAGVRANYDALNARVTALEKTSTHRFPVMQCTVRTLDKLTDKTGISPPCQLEDSE